MSTRLEPFSAAEFGAQTIEDPHHIIDFKVISDRGENIGHVKDYLIDEQGRLRYLIVDVRHWFTGKNVLIPVGMIQVEDQNRQIILSGVTKDQVEHLPKYKGMEDLNPENERKIMETLHPGQRPEMREGENRLDYERHHAFRTPARLQLLEERLQTAKRRILGGEATVRKVVETETRTIEVPVSHEELVVETRRVEEGQPIQGQERMAPGAREGAGMPGSARAGQQPGRPAGERMEPQGREFGEETMTVPLYKEEVEVTKRPVVAEEATIRKEQIQETEQVQEEVRREKLQVDDPTRKTRKDK